jgi:hypothetical protein
VGLHFQMGVARKTERSEGNPAAVLGFGILIDSF